MQQISIFINNTLRTLIYLDNVSDDGRACITQQEIAKALNVSRATVNKIIGTLKREGYVNYEGNHVARYFLTPKTKYILDGFRRIDFKLRKINS